MTLIKPTRQIVVSLIIGLLSKTSCFADSIAIDDLSSSDQSLLRSIGLVAQPSTLEGAHSHGQIGGSIGLGLRQPRPTKVLEAESETDFDDSSVLDAVQMHIVKGLDGPFDVGFSISHVQSTPGNSIAAYLQWTAFEGFKLPSLAFKIGMSKTLGYDFVDATGYSGQLLTGYDVFEFFGIHAGIGGSINYSDIDLADDKNALSLARESDASVSTKSAFTEWQDRHFLVGMSIKPWPPFVTIGGEFLRTNSGIDSVSAKISIGM